MSKAKKGPKPPTDKAQELEKLGKRINALRIAKGYSSYENFAFDHKIPRAQFGRYENGEDLRYSSLLKVIAAFDMTVVEFFSEGFD
jgi:transcriptional regulator with XRE-family HTH domain